MNPDIKIYKYLNFGVNSKLDCIPDPEAFEEINQSFCVMGFEPEL